MAKEKAVSKPPAFAAKNYPWWIVAGGFLIMATCYAAFVDCTTLFQAKVVEALGITVAQFNTGSSLMTLIAIVSSLVIGRLLDKSQARIIGSATVIICAVDLLFFSTITQLWQLYAVCLIAGFVVIAGTRLLVSVLITNWFATKRALAISIALAGSGIGSAILMPVVTGLIQGAGWRSALLMLAIICLVFALPITAGLFRNYPSEVGLQPYGSGEQEQEKEKASKSPDAPVTIAVGWKACKKSVAFWLLVIGFLMMGIENGAIIVNNYTVFTGVQMGDTYVTLGGHDPAWATAVMSFMMVVVVVGKISLGAIYDKFGLRAGTTLGSIAMVGAFISLCFPQTNWGPICTAICFGFGTCLGTVAPPVMAVKEYGHKDIGTVTGIVTAFEMFGAAVGAVTSGLIFDKALTFTPVWIFCLVCTVVMFVTLSVSVPLSKKLIEKLKAAGAPELDAEGKEIDEEPAMAEFAEAEAEEVEAEAKVFEDKPADKE